MFCRQLNGNMPNQTAAAGISSSMTMIRSAVVQKRERDENDTPFQSIPVQTAVPTPFAAPLPVYELPLQAEPSPTSKKSRSNQYEAPKVIKPSILTAMGSLVGGGGIRDVPLRRQLSGGAIDAFLGGHDNMLTDQASDRNESMPRRMSF